MLFGRMEQFVGCIARDNYFAIPKGNPTRIIGVNMDISERKRTEAALHESEERFRATFFQAAVGIAQTDNVEGEWLLLNDRLCEILGYTQAELSGKTFRDVTHLDDREHAFAGSRRLLAGEISSHAREKRYVRKDGATVWTRLIYVAGAGSERPAAVFHLRGGRYHREDTGGARPSGEQSSA